MRSLTVVRDKEGTIKIAQFGSLWDPDYPNAAAECVEYFERVAKDSCRLDVIEKKIEKIKFFDSQERINFLKRLQSGNKSAASYSEQFLESDIGVHILDKVEQFTAKTRLTSYYKYIGDTMFASYVFEIDFSQGVARILYMCREIFHHKFREGRENRFTAKKKKKAAAIEKAQEQENEIEKRVSQQTRRKKSTHT